MDYTSIIAESIKFFEIHSDKDRKEHSQSYHPTYMKVLGNKAAEIKAEVKRLKLLCKKWPDDDIIGLAKALVKTDIFECRQLGYELLISRKKLLKELKLEDVYELQSKLDNWVTIDTFSACIAGVAWREGNVPDDVIIGWANSDDFWLRRSALVCTIALNQKARGGKGDVERTLMICELLASDKQDMVAKAMSWALRELSKRDKRPVEKFLTKHDKVLPGRVRHEVRKKLDTGRKNG